MAFFKSINRNLNSGTYVLSINPGNYLLCKNRIKNLENILK